MKKELEDMPKEELRDLIYSRTAKVPKTTLLNILKLIKKSRK